VNRTQAQGRVFRAHRAARGWTQKHVAELTGLSSQSISNIERGRHSIIDLDRGLPEHTIRLMCFALDITAQEFIAQTENCIS
jgi:transcriptional regulator with XRE-family HTH domain